MKTITKPLALSHSHWPNDPRREPFYCHLTNKQKKKQKKKEYNKHKSLLLSPTILLLLLWLRRLLLLVQLNNIGNCVLFKQQQLLSWLNYFNFQLGLSNVVALRKLIHYLPAVVPVRYFVCWFGFLLLCVFYCFSLISIHAHLPDVPSKCVEAWMRVNSYFVNVVVVIVRCCVHSKTT